MTRTAYKAILVCLAVLGTGCGKGLTVNVTASPNPASPGDEVQWDVSVRNDSPCATTEGEISLPDPLPDSTGVLAFIFGFIPGTDQQTDPREFCRMFATGLNDCADQSCVEAHIQEALGPDVANALRAQMQAASAATTAPASTPGICTTLFGGTSGLVGICGFESLDPGKTGKAVWTETAPDSGNTRAVQLAIAFAPAEGNDCRPGREVAEGEWILSGCFPLPGNPAPALSPFVSGALGGLLLIGGAVGLYRRQRS
jgi:uncharacterized repeat protein (TIGR01451 family)